ncbi:MAG: Snf7 family protein [Candidatus Nitrosocaldaceae archaeon]
MSRFEKSWAKTDSRGIGEKVRDTVKPQGPLKPRITQASNKLQAQIQKMDSMLARIKERDARIFKKIVTAQTLHDIDTAKALSNELAELRKIEKTINSGKLALEQINNRLTTVQDLGDALVTLSPAINVMKSVQRGIARVMPDAESEIGDINNTLNNLLIETVSGNGFNINNDVVSEDAEKILTEATMVAESNIDTKLPVPNKSEKSELPKFE